MAQEKHVTDGNDSFLYMEGKEMKEMSVYTGSVLEIKANPLCLDLRHQHSAVSLKRSPVG